MSRSTTSSTVIVLCALSAIAVGQPGPARDLPSETPAKFVPVRTDYDFERREVEIPMRDGVKLHTVILVPRGSRRAPILLTRTPYNADKKTSTVNSTHLRLALERSDYFMQLGTDSGYIRVIQDVRGKYHSEGDYVMNRPVRGPQNPTRVDHPTDTYDTIDWLVKNVPETNGKVGIIGISYSGFTTLMGLVDPHPALQAAVPINPMVDGWRGDDWFHNGAFRQLGLTYVYSQEATRANDEEWPTSGYDEYDFWLAAGSAGEAARRRGMNQLGFWNKLVAHPSYDAFWRDQAVDRVLASKPLTVPTLLVHSSWDQEDIYGAPAVYKAIAPKDPKHEKLFLVIGPWFHAGSRFAASTIGAIPLDSATGTAFQRDILLPFLDERLKDGAPKANLAPVTAFESGTNRWRKLDTWPPAPRATRLYLDGGAKAAFAAPTKQGFDEYISDPAKPVTFVARPIIGTAYEGSDLQWRTWLASDQRHAAARPDVLVYTSDVLASPVAIAGEPLVNLVASTTGTDADWVVKLIDVYPPEVPEPYDLGGYQLPITMDIFRGRYRESLEIAKPLKASAPLVYRFALPNASHVFLPGHRIMVQIQSTWFPLYDRNPQKFVPNIMLASPGDFQKATHRVYHSPAQPSFIELPISSTP